MCSITLEKHYIHICGALSELKKGQMLSKLEIERYVNLLEERELIEEAALEAHDE